ncbi:hypothetical protein [Streptomyces mayteni]
MTVSDDILRRVHAQAARQDWVMTTAQLRGAGVERRVLRRMVRSGRWVPLARGSCWVGPASRAPSLRARVRGVLLGCNQQVVACGPTAARLLGLHGLPRDDGVLHLAAPLGHEVRGRAGVQIHRSQVPHQARTDLRGLRLTTPARTCADLLLGLGREEAVSVLDSALHRGLLTSPQEVAPHLPRRAGARRARLWLPLANGLSESPLETRIRLLCLDGGLPPPLLQWRVWDPAHGRHYRLDLGWPSQLVGVEADGKGPHGTPQALHRDRFRQNRLATLLPGLTLLRFTWADTYRPETAILAPLRRALQL